MAFLQSTINDSLMSRPEGAEYIRDEQDDSRAPCLFLITTTINMKLLAAAVALLPALASAHAIAQRVRVNGQDFGLGNGIRVASSNNPITNVNDGSIACNSAVSSSSQVIAIKPGDRVGVLWGHVVGGAQYV